MNTLIRSLFQSIRSVVGAIARRLPFVSSQGVERDPLAEKLQDIRHIAWDDEEPTRRQEGQSADTDGLAETIYRARPQNPFGKDF